MNTSISAACSKLPTSMTLCRATRLRRSIGGSGEGAACGSPAPFNYRVFGPAGRPSPPTPFGGRFFRWRFSRGWPSPPGPLSRTVWRDECLTFTSSSSRRQPDRRGGVGYERCHALPSPARQARHWNQVSRTGSTALACAGEGSGVRAVRRGTHGRKKPTPKRWRPLGSGLASLWPKASAAHC